MKKEIPHGAYSYGTFRKSFEDGEGFRMTNVTVNREILR